MLPDERECRGLNATVLALSVFCANQPGFSVDRRAALLTPLNVNARCGARCAPLSVSSRPPAYQSL